MVKPILTLKVLNKWKTIWYSLYHIDYILLAIWSGYISLRSRESPLLKSKKKSSIFCCNIRLCCGNTPNIEDPTEIEGFGIDDYGIENDSYSVCNSIEDIENEFAKAKRRISLELQWNQTFRSEWRSKKKPALPVNNLPLSRLMMHQVELQIKIAFWFCEKLVDFHDYITRSYKAFTAVLSRKTTYFIL